MYTVFHAESESAVKIDQVLHPDVKVQKSRPMRVSISYCKISYLGRAARGHRRPPQER